MKKNVWIWNHYAANMFFDRGGRHYNFAKFLREAGYFPTIFCANTVHNSDKVADIPSGFFCQNEVDELPFVFVKCSPYQGNGWQRIRNMLEFSFKVARVGRVLAATHKPDVVLVSSPHPFACVPAIRLARQLRIPCIVEIRDLWPESIVAYQGMSPFNPAIQSLYQMEKWFYKEADHIVFVMPGGYDYIRYKRWDQFISRAKCSFLPNGVDLAGFGRDQQNYFLPDSDLRPLNNFKMVYTGSIRRVYNLKKLVAAADLLRAVDPIGRISILVYGEGEELSDLRDMVKTQNLSNIIFKGRILKKFIPCVLNQADLLFFHSDDVPVIRFGLSPNKLPEYLAAGKPILSDCVVPYDIIKEHHCGEVISSQDPASIAAGIVKMANLPKVTLEEMGRNARECARRYNYKTLTGKLIELIEKLAKKERSGA